MDIDMEKTALRRALVSFYKTDIFDDMVHLFQGRNQIFYWLEQSEGEVTPSFLSKKLGVTRARMTVALCGLQEKGYIMTENCRRDRRRTLVHLTEEGKQYWQDKMKQAESFLEKLSCDLGVKDTKELCRLLLKSSQIMDQWGAAEG